MLPNSLQRPLISLARLGRSYPRVGVGDGQRVRATGQAPSSSTNPSKSA